MGKQDIPSLTGLRAVAALCVAVAHITMSGNHTVFGVPLSLTPVGIPLFFTLSGFVIHYAYAASYRDGWVQATGNFAFARFARLYPLFAFLLTFYAVTHALGTLLAEHPGVAVSYATLTSSWWYSIDGRLVTEQSFGVSWSVSTEVFFYIAYALGLYRIGRMQDPRACIIALVALCIAAYAFFYIVFRNVPSDWDATFQHWLFYIAPYGHLFEFAGGVLTCQIYLLLRGSPMPNRLPAVLCFAGTAWIVALTGCLLSWFVYPDINQFAAFRFVNFLHKSFLMAPGCYLLMLGLALGPSSVERALSCRAMVFLGTISYSIYLLHPLVQEFAYVPPTAAHPLLSLALEFMMLFIFSAGSYAIIEKPAKEWLKEMSRRLKALVSDLRAVPVELGHPQRDRPASALEKRATTAPSLSRI
jgi:peptidoglycan/LPS O-acetylase OafA/YrhL